MMLSNDKLSYTMLHFCCWFFRSQGSSTRSDESAADTERKIAFMVAFIVLTFVLFNLPSIIAYMIQVTKSWWSQTNFNFDVHLVNYKQVNFMYLQTSGRFALKLNVIMMGQLSNTCVMTGKALNFPLYCLSSSTFRRKLSAVFGLEERMRKFSDTLTTMVSSLRSVNAQARKCTIGLAGRASLDEKNVREIMV